MKNCLNVTVNEKGEPFIRNGQLWLYRSNVSKEDDGIGNGSIVNIINEKQEYIATGMYSKSHIAVRILTFDNDVIIDDDYFYKKIESSYLYRKTLDFQNITNCRLIFGEADELPGLTVDRYNDILVTQISTYGMEQFKNKLYKMLLDVFAKHDEVIHGIYERNDIAIRVKEGLKEEKGWVYNPDHLSCETIINENGLLLHVDVENGQKTGYFLDQKSNRYLLRKMSKGLKVCDCFSHTGGFALNAALGGAQMVYSVDVSKTALDQGLANARLNHLEDKITFVEDDVFHFLDVTEKGKFDLIVLDPPAFTKSRRTVDHAYNGYKEINCKAMKLLNKGGFLITCSCSRYMETELFEQMLKDAAKEAHVFLKQVSVTQQNSDHPILWNMMNTSYLKFYIFEIV